MPKKVRAKKKLGQHFLTDQSIAKATVDAFNQNRQFKYALEIGPGMGVLTQYLVNREDLQLKVIDIDEESIEYLLHENWIQNHQLISADFLKLNLNDLYKGESFGIIGNFPYNISTQILFKVLEHKNQVVEVVGMFQKEVAERITSTEGSKIYGITSVLLQAFFDVEYLFTVEETVFNPPPKVKSAVIRLKRNAVKNLSCDEKQFKQLVKLAFNQRRKTLRNSLKPLLREVILDNEILSLRPEQLSVQEFVELTNLIHAAKN